MDAMRRAFSLQFDAEKDRHVRRVWLRNPFSGKSLPFPAPVVSRYEYKPELAKLCAKHKIEVFDSGKVAERSCMEGLNLAVS